MGCLVAFLGGLIGTVVGMVSIYFLMSGIEADAFTWMVMFLFFGFVGGCLGIATALFWRRSLLKRRRHFADLS